MSAERLNKEDLHIISGKVYTAGDYSFRMEAQATIYENFGHEIRARALTKIAEETNQLFEPEEKIIPTQDPDGSTTVYGIGSLGWLTNNQSSKPC